MIHVHTLCPDSVSSSMQYHFIELYAPVAKLNRSTQQDENRE